jgi:hypothetical protein
MNHVAGIEIEVVGEHRRGGEPRPVIRGFGGRKVYRVGVVPTESGHQFHATAPGNRSEGE